MTAFVPPSSMIVDSAICWIFIIVTITCCKLHPLMIAQIISCRPRTTSKLLQCILFRLTSNCKLRITSVRIVSFEILQLYYHFICSLFSDLVNRFQSQPKLLPNGAKPSFILIPTSVKVNRSVESLLKHQPSTAESLHLAEHSDGIDNVRDRHFVQTRVCWVCSLAGFDVTKVAEIVVILQTALFYRCFKIKGNILFNFVEFFLDQVMICTNSLKV